MMCAPVTSICGASEGRWPPSPTAGRSTSPSCCSCRAWARGRVCARAGGRGGTWRAEPLCRPGALLFGARGQGWASISRSASRLRPDARCAQTAIGRAKLGNGEQLEALRRLDEQSRRLDQAAVMTPATFERAVADELRAKTELGGRTAFDDPGLSLRISRFISRSRIQSIRPTSPIRRPSSAG
jgi:hypothetical protein